MQKRFLQLVILGASIFACCNAVAQDPSGARHMSLEKTVSVVDKLDLKWRLSSEVRSTPPRYIRCSDPAPRGRRLADYTFLQESAGYANSEVCLVLGEERVLWQLAVDENYWCVLSSAGLVAIVEYSPENLVRLRIVSPSGDIVYEDSWNNWKQFRNWRLPDFGREIFEFTPSGRWFVYTSSPANQSGDRHLAHVFDLESGDSWKREMPACAIFTTAFLEESRLVLFCQEFDGNGNEVLFRGIPVGDTAAIRRAQAERPSVVLDLRNRVVE